jgi:hypothetical protein
VAYPNRDDIAFSIKRQGKDISLVCSRCRPSCWQFLAEIARCGNPAAVYLVLA